MIVKVTHQCPSCGLQEEVIVQDTSEDAILAWPKGWFEVLGLLCCLRCICALVAALPKINRYLGGAMPTKAVFVRFGIPYPEELDRK